jgi:hypothetical protein
MKSSSLLGALGLIVILSSAASAAPLSWSHQISGNPLKFLQGTGSSSYFTGTFDLTTDGFDASTMSILGATASFAFADDSDSAFEYVDISINNLILINDQEVDGTHPSSNFAWYSDSLTNPMLIALQDDGKVSFKVQLLNTAGTNDTYIKKAKLVAHGESKVTVPDAGATAVLIGLSFAGLIGLRRRL